ncbi:hypothetical protein [Stackebrandtia soli]|uniref:hypothetical protein n=1 Tax=Stackebrandtia soli TaxID=1892856 RepID=UPI0039EB769E
MGIIAGDTTDEVATSDTQLMERVEELLDLAATRSIEDEDGCWVHEDAMEPFQDLYERQTFAFAAHPANAAELKTYLEDTGAVAYGADDVVEVDVPQYGAYRWYLRGGGAWRQRREQFAIVRRLSERAFSYKRERLLESMAVMEQVRDGLAPAVDQPDLEAIEDINLTGEGAMDQLASLFDATWDWGVDIEGVRITLSKWEGAAAFIFTCQYCTVMPSILLGHALIAHILAESLDLVQAAFDGIRTQSSARLSEALYLLELYPGHTDVQTTETDWAAVLNIVSGVTSVLAGATGGVPVVAGAFGVISGAASLAVNIIGSPGYTEIASRKPDLSGATVTEIMMNLAEILGAYLDAVENTERVLAEFHTEFRDYVTNKTVPGLEIANPYGNPPYWNLARHNVFFVPKEPDIGKIDSGDSFSEISSDDVMGPAPDDGLRFRAELTALLNSGHVYLPALSERFHSLIGRGADEGLGSGFDRVSSDIHGQTHGGQGVLYPQWQETYELFESVLSQTAENLDSAAAGLIAAAWAYAEQDQVAKDAILAAGDYLP